MSSAIGSKLSIGEIKPVDFSASGSITAWEETISHAKKPFLKEIIQIRSRIQESISNQLSKEGFIHPPVHMFSTCVDPLNHETETAGFNYYGQECTLMQSLIFHKMAIISLTDIEDVFWISPNIRKERNVKSPQRYASEFTQIDFESSSFDMDSCMKFIEKIITVTVNTLADEYSDLIERISGRKLQKIAQPFTVYDVVEAAEELGIKEEAVEAALASIEPQPFFLTNMKREAYDRRCDETGKYKNYDLVMPKVGEILSGAEREFTHDKLESRMKELSYPLEYFEPILKLAREHGLKPTAGGGFGVERLTRAILLLDDIAEIYPFKRVPEKMIIF